MASERQQNNKVIVSQLDEKMRVVDSDASSYVQRDVNAVLSSIEHLKKQKYSQAAECVHASFTHLLL